MLRTLRGTKNLKLCEKSQGSVAYLGDTTLHNYKVGIIDIELDGLKERLDILLKSLVPV